MNYHRFIALVIHIFLVQAITATAQEFASNDPSPPSSGQDEVLLKDGNLLRGHIIEELPEAIIFESDSLGKIEISRENIKNFAYFEATEGAIDDPDQNSIMFCPTPATLPKGDAYFRDFELLILNFGFGVTDNFDLSFATFFPVSSSLLMISAGAKWRLLDRDIHPVGLALTGSFTKMEDLYFATAGGVIGVGNAQKSLNLSISQTFDDEKISETVYILGADIQSSHHSKLFAEYLSSSSIFNDNDFKNGFINIGVRIFGQNHSFSFSGFRPLQTDTGSFLAFPMLSFSTHW